MAIRSHNLKQKGPKLSRTDKWRRNPIPWIILLIVSAAISWNPIWPMSQDYLAKKKAVSEFKKSEPILQKKQEELQIKFDIAKADFDKAASDIQAKEKQLFPESIDTSKIIKILELYSLLLNFDINGQSQFSLESVNFSSSQLNQEAGYATLKASIRAIGTKEDINEFVDFLKTGEVPEEQAQKKEDETGLRIDLRFLNQNLLPLASLNSLRITQYSGPEKRADLLSVELQVNFYSQQ